MDSNTNFFISLFRYFFPQLYANTPMVSLCFLFSITYSSELYAQSAIVQGKIVSAEDGTPLVGVSVVVKGEDRGTTSDKDGNYRIQVVPRQVLVFSIVGYLSKDILVDKQRIIDIQLQPQVSALSEVVVVGYQVVEKRDLSTSISSITANDIKDIPVSNSIQALVGKMPGVSLQQVNGIPGIAPAIRIRGSGSINNTNSPIFVIDGYPTEDIQLVNAIHPTDIASVDVLKDAASAAIYGSRAGNGVIVITTKQGHLGQARFTTNLVSGYEEVTKKYPVMGPYEYVEMAKEALTNQGREIPQIFTNPNLWRVTDWQDEIFRKGDYRDFQISASGGTNHVKYSIGGGYLSQDGILRNTYYKRYNSRINLDVDLSSKLKLNVNVLPSYADRRNQDPRGASNGNNKNGMLLEALGMPPILPVYQENGDYFVIAQSEYAGIFNNQQFNPVQKLDANKEYQKFYTLKASSFLNYQPFEGLDIKSLINIGAIGRNDELYVEPFMAWNTNGIGNKSTPNMSIVTGNRMSGTSVDLYWSNTATYKKTLVENHSLTFLLGYDVSQYSFYNVTISPRTDASNPVAFTNPNIKNVMGANLRTGTSTKVSSTSDAIFGRFMYAYKQRYMLTSSLRGDRSSRFGPAHRRGIFPSISGAWRLSGERFMQEANWLSEFKLRASFGISGNNQLGSQYPWVGTIGQNSYVFGRDTDYEVIGRAPISFTNAELAWEKNRQLDIGLDFSILNERIGITIDWYERNSNTIYNSAVPTINGVSSAVRQNIGNIENKGVEIALDLRNRIGPVRWNNNFNISFNKNTITDLGPQDRTNNRAGGTYGGAWDNVIRNIVGRPMGDIYLYVVEGTFNTQEDLDKYAKLGTQGIGNLRFKDVNNDGVINPEDMAFVGNHQPKFIYGFNSSVSYKGLELSVVLHGQRGGVIVNTLERQISLIRHTENASMASVNRWKSADNTGSGFHQRAGSPNFGNDTGPNTRFLYSSDFLRIRNVALSYSVPSRYVNKVKLNGIRLHATCQNLFTFTKFPSFNPEANYYGDNAGSNGVDQGAYPLSRNVSLGIGLTF